MPENTINALRQLNVGIEAVQATGTLTMDTQPTATDTVTIHGVVYTWRAIVDTDVAGEISIGADLAAAKLNFVAAVNATASPNTEANPYVVASAFVGDVCTLTARIPGPFGSTITLAETFTAVTNIFNAATLGATIAGSHARGTAVAATARLAVEQLEFGNEDENIYRARVATGLLMRNRARGTVVQHGTRFTLPDQALIWEQLPLWLAMLVDGVPTLTGPVGGPYVWTFVSDPTTNPNPVTVTLQRRFSNGLGDVIDERAPYCMMDAFSLSFAANEHLRFSGGGFARKFETSAITGGLTLPSFEVGVSALSRLYVDDLWANVGDTLLAEQVIGWKLDIMPGVFPRPTAEGRTDLSFTKHQVNGDERGLALEIQCLLDPATYAAEILAADTPATNQRAVRLAITGTDGRELFIDMLMQHSKPGPWAPSVDQGQDVITLMLEETTDQTNFFQVTLTHPDVHTLA